MPPLTLAADFYFLVNPFTPLIALVILMGWAWLVSSRLDKDAQYYHFKREQWNLAHLIAGTLGLATMFAPVPEAWWIGVGLVGGTIVMFSTVLTYWVYRNRNVPEKERFYLSLDSMRRNMQQRKAQRAARAATISIVDSKGAKRIPPAKEDARFPVHLAMEELVAPAILARAGTIEVVPAKGGMYQISQIVDGVRYKRDPLDGVTGSAVIDYLKEMAGVDVADKRRKQRGDFGLDLGADYHEARLHTAGSSAGQSMVLEFNVKQRVNIKPADLGLLSKQLTALDELVRDPHGIVLVAAPADGGRTTTLYSLLRRHDAFTTNIRTLELEQFLQLDGVGHAEFDPTGEDADFAIQLRSMLRRDPNIVMISDLVSPQTALEAAAPGMGGPLIYVGLRAESGLEAIATWLKAVGDLQKGAAPLRGVIFERLVRKLCDCKIAYRPPAEQLKKLGLPADQVRQLFNPSGKIVDRNREETCPQCGGLGYRGQSGVFEIMIFDNEARALIAKGDLNGLKTHMRRLGGFTLQQAGLRKAIEGVTSIDEIIRISRPPQKGGGAGAAAQSKPEAAPVG